jgi:hypothetical protein
MRRSARHARRRAEGVAAPRRSDAHTLPSRQLGTQTPSYRTGCSPAWRAHPTRDERSRAGHSALPTRVGLERIRVAASRSRKESGARTQGGTRATDAGQGLSTTRAKRSAAENCSGAPRSRCILERWSFKFAVSLRAERRPGFRERKTGRAAAAVDIHPSGLCGTRARAPSSRAFFSCAS